MSSLTHHKFIHNLENNSTAQPIYRGKYNALCYLVIFDIVIQEIAKHFKFQYQLTTTSYIELSITTYMTTIL